MSITELNDVPWQEIIEGFKAKFVHTENNTFAFWKVKESAVLPAHKHIQEQVSMVTKGEFELTIDGRTQLLKPNMVVIIPPNSMHLGKAVTDCELTDVFYPARDDYKK